MNLDPSHLVWQFIDYERAVYDFKDRIFHVHAKDTRMDRAALDDVGIMATPLAYHQPKIPGAGEIDWERFLKTLAEVGYNGPVCIEVEDRAYEHSLEARKTSLKQSAVYLRQFIADQQIS